MTAETDLLPLPTDHCGDDDYPRYTAADMQTYARANLAELQREVDGLRAEVAVAKDGWHMANGTADLAMKHRDAAEARAERLAEALRDMLDEYGQLHAKFDLGECQATMNARAALEQERGRG